MLLRNFYNVLATIMIGNKRIGSTSAYGDGVLNAKQMTGTVSENPISAIGNTSTNFLFPWYSIDNTSTGLPTQLVFGTGNTPVTFDDYTLTNYKYFQVTSYAWDGLQYNSETKTFSNTARISLTNNTGSDFVVSEIGISANKRVLYYREVLDTPITIPAGKAITYTHEFKFTMPQ